MKNLIEQLKNSKTFLVFLFILFISGLTDLISTTININILHIAYESNFYIPFLSTLIFAFVLVINRLFLNDRFFIFSGCVVVLCSFIPLINNIIVYIYV